MIRTALRLGTIPLFAGLILAMGLSVAFWQWVVIALFSPFVLGLVLLSYWRLEADSPQGAVPLWARKLAPYVWCVCIAVTLSVPLTSWPLHSAFQASKPDFERAIADRQAGQPMIWPQQFGEFEVSQLSIEDGTAIFYLTSEDGDQPDRIVRLSHFEPSERKDGNAVVALGERWVYEDAGD